MTVIIIQNIHYPPQTLYRLCIDFIANKMSITSINQRLDEITQLVMKLQDDREMLLTQLINLKEPVAKPVAKLVAKPKCILDELSEDSDDDSTYVDVEESESDDDDDSESDGDSNESDNDNSDNESDNDKSDSDDSCTPWSTAQATVIAAAAALGRRMDGNSDTDSDGNSVFDSDSVENSVVNTLREEEKAEREEGFENGYYVDLDLKHLLKLCGRSSQDVKWIYYTGIKCNRNHKHTIAEIETMFGQKYQELNWRWIVVLIGAIVVYK